MKKILSILFFLSITAFAFSAEAVIENKGTLHILLFCDTDDPSAGKTCYEDLMYFHDTFIPELKAKSGMAVNEYYCYGKYFSGPVMDELIASLRTGADDAIFFYYSGHGGNSESSEFPFMALNRSYKSLLNVYYTLRAKPHRLLVTICTACNSMRNSHLGSLDTRTRTLQEYAVLADGEMAAEGPVAHDLSGSSRLMAVEANIYRKLFKEAKGDYLVSSSRNGQVTKFSRKVSRTFFLRGLSDTFESPMKEVSWPYVIVSSGQAAMSYSQSFGSEQVQAQWLSGAYAPGKVKIINRF